MLFPPDTCSWEQPIILTSFILTCQQHTLLNLGIFIVALQSCLMFLIFIFVHAEEKSNDFHEEYRSLGMLSALGVILSTGAKDSKNLIDTLSHP